MIPLKLFAATLAFFLLAALAPAGAAVLPVDQAFRVSGRLGEDGQITVRLRVAPGHYLYQDKLRFSAEPAGVTLGAPRLPPGQEIDDEFFGRVRIYRGEVEARFAVQRLPPGAAGLTLVVRFQGCADAGVCYTPREQRLALERGRPETAVMRPAPGPVTDALREPALAR